MKKIISFVIAPVLLFSLLIAPAVSVRASDNPPTWRVAVAAENKISSSLQAQLESLQPDETVTVIVQLRQQANLPQGKGLGRAEQLSRVIEALTFTAEKTQGPVKNFLDEKRSNGGVKSYISFWVFNGFSVTATYDATHELAAQPDVLSISADELDIVPASSPQALSNPEPNISLVNAPALWSMGYTGQGVVVASMDSGVSMSHADLSSRWRGGSNSWYDPYGQHATPADLSGHGTWTMGVMVGGDSGGSSIGVAPGAQWVAVKMFNDAGSSTATAIHQGYQWLLDPDGNAATADAPDVVNNSWTFAYPGCYLDFEPDLQALRAAGILPVFAAGNGGPNSNTSYSPANNPSAFAVGSIDNNSNIYGLSSRGPTTCGGSTGVFPELVAPGVNVRTTDLGGFYTTASGTSLSSPHVAGGLALLLSAYSNISASQQQNALLASAVDLGASGPDDIYGYGRLDLPAAYQWLVTASTATPTPLPTFTPTATPTAAPAAALHVGDLDRSSVLAGTKWNGTVTIYVHDNNHQPVSGATVYGKWTNGATGNVSCATNSSGICSITKTGLKTTVASITFTVTNITRTGLTYQSSANHDPDGESNGTVIIVSKP